MEMKEKEKDLLIQLDARERQEEIFWKKKSRVKWIQEGEKNTKFFHNRLSLKIHKIKKADGTQVETRGEVEEELTSYFKGIITKENSDKDQNIDCIIALIPRKVTREDNEMLNNPISMQEVE